MSSCEVRKSGKGASIVCSGPAVLTGYRCSDCSAEHESYDDARRCRCPRDVYEYYVCPHCKKEYGIEDEAQDCAYACLMLQPQPVPNCEVCGAEIQDMSDIHDSEIIGSLLRCRSCIQKIAQI